MDFGKFTSSAGASSISMPPINFLNMVVEKACTEQQEKVHAVENLDVDLREVYFLIMHFLSLGPCQRTFGQLWNELLEHDLLPRRYHAWFSRSGAHSGYDDDNGISLPLGYNILAESSQCGDANGIYALALSATLPFRLIERYPHIEKDHLVKLLKQLLLYAASSIPGSIGDGASNVADVFTSMRAKIPNAAHAPTLLGSGDRSAHKKVKALPQHLRWPHMQADQVRGLSLREIGGGFARHHRASSIRSACYAIAKPSTMVQKMQNIKKLRGHRNAVYCAIFDRSGRYVITGSDDRLVKVWSMETAFCLASCRGHEGDITDLAVSSTNALVASASNDFVIRVWRLPDGFPTSVLQGHSGAVTAIAFSPRPSSLYQLLSSSDDGTCRIWDARYSQCSLRIYVPKPSDAVTGKSICPSNNGPSSSNSIQSNQILCCAFNANGTVFVTGSSDTYARVWNACKSNTDELEQPIHEMDLLSGHENDVNYVQFSGCAVASRSSLSDNWKEENIPKFKNSWFSHDNLVTCSRDGSAIIWIPRSRRSHGKSARWTRAYHLKVPPPPLPPQPPRGGPRQRILPTPRGVNMIVWSLDNRFVLAAIMDCRICVWNAADSSLVHSLTGHTASSYVLDVHPFNPRIAMSAGYDGQTIVWDIWEGIPIRTYQIGRVKLVDGKFSPDGTSIVLSDDVGQIYLLSTGQGESQKDAKYDQFFLGDYRPLIRDAAGYVLDQETQLVPHRRNIEDPLCDSSLIPYPEPYQTMFQRRRLGALGVEWRPSSIKFAVGPDFSLGQDYHLPPLEDLDRMIEPLPEFLDDIYWQPEEEVISVDNDSEYNGAEECATEGEQGSVCCSSPSDPDCSDMDSDAEHSQKDSIRRSRRRKHKTEGELISSSRRRAKKRSLGEHDHSMAGSNGVKKLKGARKVSKRKSSKAKSLRPQRVAARNAQNIFSKYTGTSTEGDDEDDSEDYMSNSESGLQDSNIEGTKSDRRLKNAQENYMEEEKLMLAEDIVKPPEPQSVPVNRKKLVLKLSLRDSKKPVSPKDSRLNGRNHTDFTNPSLTFLEEDKINVNSPDPASPSANDLGKELAQNTNGLDIVHRAHRKKVEDHMDESVGGSGAKDKWRGVKIHTPKLSGLGDVILGDREQFGVNALQIKNGVRIEQLVPADRNDRSLPIGDFQSHQGTSAANANETPEGEDKDGFVSRKFRNYDSVETGEVTGMISEELKENPPPKVRLKIRTKGIFGDPTNSTTLKPLRAMDVSASDRGGIMSEDVSRLKQKSLGVCEKGEGSGRSISFRHFHKREMSCEEPSVGVEKLSHATDYHSSEDNFSEAENDDAMRRTRSMMMKPTSREHNVMDHNFWSSLGDELVGKSRNADSEVLLEERISSSKTAVRSRSGRNRRSGMCGNDSRSSGSKLNYPIQKLSWLVLSKHEEGYRYIPQLGDEVVYLRQGHEEYIETNSSREKGPWASVPGCYISAVEICRVEHLDYATVPGSGDSCCKITLRFVDPESGAYGKKFKFTLPELINFSDFVVEKSRYDAAISRSWSPRDRCLVWWKNENGESGDWWDGRILASQAKSNDFPDSPWERYHIQYKTDPKPHLHSPWELQDPYVLWEHPHIDFETRDKLLSSLTKLERTSRDQDFFGIQKLNEVSLKLDFFNRFPVPVYPQLIRLRLENNYYRHLDAVEHDVNVMLENAQSYFVKSADMSTKIKRLSQWYTKKLSKL